MRVAAVSAGILALVVASAAPVDAKGLASGVIEGEGLPEPVVIGDVGSATGWSYPGEVWRDFGLDAAFGAMVVSGDEPPQSLDDPAPTGDVGPELTVTWTMPGPGGDHEIVQQLYPYFGPGPVVCTAAGQALPSGDDTRGGCLRRGPELVEHLQAIGLPDRAALVAASAESGADVRADAEVSSGPRWTLAGGILAVVIVSGGGVVALVRRGRRAAPASS